MSEQSSGGTYQRNLNPCNDPYRSHRREEHVVGESPKGHDIIDVVCRLCGHRVAQREVASNPDGERYDDFDSGICAENGCEVDTDTSHEGGGRDV